MSLISSVVLNRGYDMWSLKYIPGIQSKYPLSNDIICLRFRDMSKDILQQMIADMKASPFKASLQLDDDNNNIYLKYNIKCRYNYEFSGLYNKIRKNIIHLIFLKA